MSVPVYTVSVSGVSGADVASMTYILIDMGTCSIHHNVAGDVGLHTLGHENTRTLLLVVSVLVAEISDHLRATRLIPI